MAHLWRFDEDDWTILPLCDEAYMLDEWPPVRVADLGDWLDTIAESGALSSCVVLTSVGGPAASRDWVVMTSAPRAAHVNGLPVLAGIRVLSDRDELRVDDAAVYFSTERLAELTSLPVTKQEIYCPRCRDSIRVGTPAVQCPQCDVWHHQEADRPCWTYADGCAACGHPTAFDAGYTWIPES